MNGVGERKRETETETETERERESDRTGGAAESGKSSFFYHSFYILNILYSILVHF